MLLGHPPPQPLDATVPLLPSLLNLQPLLLRLPLPHLLLLPHLPPLLLHLPPSPHLPLLLK